MSRPRARHPDPGTRPAPTTHPAPTMGPRPPGPPRTGPTGASGMMNARMTYSRIVKPPRKTDRIQRTRTSVGSSSRYSAMPPATPASCLSYRLRYRRRVFTDSLPRD